MAEIQSGHDFEILFLLCGRASGHLVEPLAHVGPVGAYEFRKRVEEMVVAGDSRRGHKAAHRKSVDDRVVQVRVSIGLRDRDLTIGADWMGQIALSQALRFHERKPGKRHTEIVSGTGANPRFRVYSSIQMIVQIAALGHTREKGTQCEGVCASHFKSARNALL